MKPDRNPLASHQIHLVTVLGVCVSERVERGVGNHLEPCRIRISNYFCLGTYVYCAVDTYGDTIDFLLTEHRDKDAALRFLKKAIRRHGVPETITIDGSDANEVAIKSSNAAHGTSIAIRQ